MYEGRAGKAGAQCPSVDIFRGGRPHQGQPQDGDEIDVVDAAGTFPRRGLLNRRSQIVVRLFTWNVAEDSPSICSPSELHRHRRVARLSVPDTTAWRVVFSESDGLPGLVVDRYGDVLVVYIGTLGLQQRKEMVVAALDAALALPQSSSVPMRKPMRARVWSRRVARCVAMWHRA